MMRIVIVFRKVFIHRIEMLVELRIMDSMAIVVWLFMLWLEEDIFSRMALMTVISVIVEILDWMYDLTMVIMMIKMVSHVLEV